MRCILINIYIKQIKIELIKLQHVKNLDKKTILIIINVNTTNKPYEKTNKGAFKKIKK